MNQPQHILVRNTLRPTQHSTQQNRRLIITLGGLATIAAVLLVGVFLSS